MYNIFYRVQCVNDTLSKHAVLNVCSKRYLSRKKLLLQKVRPNVDEAHVKEAISQKPNTL